MNHIYRVVFNKQTGTFQAVSETAKSHTKQSTKGSAKNLIRKIAQAVALALGLSGVSTLALAAPTGGQVVAGQANIAQVGNITDINQASQNAVINWQDFGIKAHETVNFHQPNSEALTLNRVIGNQRSVIDGAMNANGKIFIQNENGTLIGKNAQINVGSLVATTAKISNDDFMNGNYRFDGAQGSIENLGQISVPKGGVVALVAPIVKNTGTITANEGKVLLASAENFSITLPDNANFAYTLDKGTLQGLVDNGGAILADAGRVVLTAKGVDTVKKSLIKHSGNIEANTVQNKNGVIELVGDLDNSALSVSGSLKAEAKESGDGGFIETSASSVKIENSAEVSTLAENGKTGTWLIDPNDIIIANSAGVKPDGTPYTKDEVTVNGLKIANQLTKSNVTIQSTKGKSEGKGDVIIDDEISGGNPHTNPVHTLTLNARNDIHINKNIDLKGAVKLALEYGGSNSSESDVKLNNKSKINLPEGQTLSVKKGSSEKYDLLVVHSLPDGQDFLGKDIAIGKDIDMSGINRSNGWYFPKNHDSYYGSLWGLGHNIDNLTITGTNEVGLVPKLDGGVIRDLNLNNVNITGNENVGGIIGKAYSHGTPTKIQNIDISGSISGNKSIGGIIGNAELRGTGGGLYGTDGIIDVKKINTNLTVKGSNDVGGVVGYSQLQGVGAGGAVLDISKINTNNSHIAGKENIGGIVGNTEVASTGIARLEIKQSAINSNISGDSNIGGLIGNSSVMSGGTWGGWSDIFIRDNYSNANIQGKTNIGGLIGKLKTNSGIAEVDRVYFINQAKGVSNVNLGIGLTELVNSSNFEIKFKDSFFDKSKISHSDKNGLKGKTTKEMQQKSTFTDWDFDTVWRIQEGVDYPRLRALTEGKVTIKPANPTDPNKNPLTIYAHNLSKVYDGKVIATEDDLHSLAVDNGYRDIIDAEGLLDGDNWWDLEGKLVYGGNWKGAKNVGKYTIIPTGLTGGQKYEIEFEEGDLTINKAPLTIIAMNNIKPAGKNNPPKENIGVLAKGLVKGEQISDVKISYSDNNTNKDAKGHISEIIPSDAVFFKGESGNYDITYKNGKLLVVQSNYDLNEKFNEETSLYHAKIKEYREVLNNIEHEMLLAKAVYGSDNAKEGDADSFYDITKDSSGNFAMVGYRENHNNKFLELIDKQEDINGQLEGFTAALYKQKDSNQYYVVFRGSGSIDPKHWGDWQNNIQQITNISPLQNAKQYNYAEIFANRAMEYVKEQGGQATFVGHSLGGGLATYAAAKSKYDVPVVTFNPATLGFGSLLNIAIFNNKYGKNVPPYHHYTFDGDILNTVANPVDNMGTKYEFNLLSTKSKIGDHLMDHVLTTKSLSNIMAENIENTNLKDKNGNICIGCLQYVRQNKYFNIKDDLPITNKFVDRNQWISDDRERTIGNIQSFNRQVLDEWRNNHYKFKKPEMLGKDGVELFNKELLMTATHVILGSIELYDGTTNKYIPFNQNSPFYLKNGDKIRSGKYKSRIRFPDDSIIELEPNSEVQINVVPNQLWADTIIVLKGKLPKKTAQGRLYWK